MTVQQFINPTVQDTSYTTIQKSKSPAIQQYYFPWKKIGAFQRNTSTVLQSNSFIVLISTVDKSSISTVQQVQHSHGVQIFIALKILEGILTMFIVIALEELLLQVQNRFFSSDFQQGPSRARLCQ